MTMEPKAIRLSDDWHQDEPLAYLVKCYDTTLCEYKVFTEGRDARDFASEQEDLARGAGQTEDWQVYPLYAGQTG